MAFIHVPKPWQLLEQEATPEATFLNRRRFLKTLVGAGIAGSVMPMLGCQRQAIATDAH